MDTATNDSFQDEIRLALSTSEENIPLEGTMSPDESPLNDPVSESDIGLNKSGNHTTTSTQHQPQQWERPRLNEPDEVPDFDFEPPYQEEAQKAAFNREDKKETAQGSDADAEPSDPPVSDAWLGLQADSYLGMADYVLDFGGGLLVKMKQHPEFCEFKEVVEMIDTMNEQNMQRIRLSVQEKLMLRPLIIEVLRTNKKQLKPGDHLLMTVLAIAASKAQAMFAINREVRAQTKEILEAVREMKAESSPAPEPEPYSEPVAPKTPPTNTEIVSEASDPQETESESASSVAASESSAASSSSPASKGATPSAIGLPMSVMEVAEDG